MAPKKAQPKKRMPSPSSSDASSSEDEPEIQVNSTQVSRNPAAAAAAAAATASAAKASHSAPPAPTLSSSSEESGGSSDESDSTKEEDNDVTKQQSSNKKTPQQQPLTGKKAREAPPSSGSESESEKEEDEDEDEDDDDDEKLPLSQRGRNLDPSAKPAGSKPAASKTKADEAAAVGAKKQQDDKKRKAPLAASPSKTKDKVENNEKKRKVAAVPPSPAKGENADTPKKRFERIWTPEDELALLRGLKTFKNEHGHEPFNPAEFDDLYKSVKTAFHTDISRPQFLSKLGNLKRRHAQASKKKKKKITNAIAQEASDLAVMIWGEWKKGTDGEADGGIPESAMNGPVANGGKNPGPLLRPKAEYVECTLASEQANAGAPEHGSLSLKELVSFPGGDNGGSAIVDFIVNQFDWMDRGTIIQSIARLDSAGCKALEEIWDRLKNREMQFQLHRLEAATDMIKLVKGAENL